MTLANKSLRTIAAELLQIDAWVLATFTASINATPQLASPSLLKDFEDTISEDIQTLSNAVLTTTAHEVRLGKFAHETLEQCSEEQITGIICDLGSSSYYEQFIHLRSLLFASARSERADVMSLVSQLQEILFPPKLLSPQEYMTILEVQCSIQKRALKAVITVCRGLRDRIKLAADLGQLAPRAEDALKQKMKEL